MVDFRGVVDTLVSIGVFEVLLPFLLVYAIVFAVLQKAQIFEGGSSSSHQAKNINAVIAAVFGLFAVASIQVVQFFQTFIVNALVLIVFILCILIVLGLIFGDKYDEIFQDQKIKYALAGLVTIVLLVVLINVLGWWDLLVNWWDSQDRGLSDTGVTLLVVLGVGVVLYLISKDTNPK